jgi:hypothetical protein
MIAVLAALWLSNPLVDVAAEGACPSVGQVERHLAELIPATAASPSGGQRHRASFTRGERGIHVELHSADALLIAQRDLAAEGSCDELASALAVVIAAWEAELDPRLANGVELPASPAPEAPTLPAPRAPRVILPRRVVPPSPPRRPPPRYALGLSFFASRAGGDLAPGARIEGSLAPGGWGLGVTAGLSTTGERTQDVGGMAGAARWVRTVLAVGPRYSFGGGGAVLDIQAQALVGLLRVEGVALPVTTSDSSVELGTAAGLRAGWSWGTTAAWLGFDALVWPGRADLQIGGLPDRGTLPRLDLQLGAGLAIGRFL